jgi:outer membrane biosynthesis protein TonB
VKRQIFFGIAAMIIAVSVHAQTAESAIKAAMISAPRPQFPAEATARHVAGCGLYQIDIGPKTGAPLKIEIIQNAGHPALNRAAVNGLMLWRARPGGVRAVKLPVCFEFKSGKPIVTYGN